MSWLHHQSHPDIIFLRTCPLRIEKWDGGHQKSWCHFLILNPMWYTFSESSWPKDIRPDGIGGGISDGIGGGIVDGISDGIGDFFNLDYDSLILIWIPNSIQILGSFNPWWTTYTCVRGPSVGRMRHFCIVGQERKKHNHETSYINTLIQSGFQPTNQINYFPYHHHYNRYMVNWKYLYIPAGSGEQDEEEGEGEGHLLN